MLEIDLLLGSGRPAKPQPKRVLLWCLLYAALVSVGLWLAQATWSIRNDIRIQKHTVSQLTRQIDAMHQVTSFLTRLDAQQKNLAPKMTSLSQILPNHIQWSPILADIARQAPRGLIISDFVAQQNEIRTKTQTKQSSYTLTLGAFTASNPYLVERFMQSLRTSNWAPGFDKEVRIATQTQREIQGQTFLYFAIECLFTPSQGKS